MSDYYTTEEICRKIQISLGTCYNRLSEKKPMPPTITIGRRRLFPKKEFEEWMRARIEINDEASILGLQTGIKK